MDTNELLRKRVIVTAYYPNCPWQVGEVLQVAEDWELYSNITGYVQSKNIVKYETALKSGANFQQLQWWEKREEKDLPEYVRLMDDSVVKVNMWRTAQIDLHINGKIVNCIWLDDLEPIPATEQEYTEYVKSKK